MTDIDHDKKEEKEVNDAIKDGIEDLEAQDPIKPKTPTVKDRRKYNRSKERMFINIDGKEYETRDVSEAGASLYGPEGDDYETDRSYDIILTIRGVKVKAKIHIVHANPEPKRKRIRYGVEFLYDVGSERTMVQKFITSRGYGTGTGKEVQSHHWRGPQKHFKGERKPSERPAKT